jgi:ribosome-binding protein aMBF1 (putative translation factor)
MSQIYDVLLKHGTVVDPLNGRVEAADLAVVEGKEMERNRIGNLLAGSRLKAGLTQAQLAEKLGIRQNMVSDYERGRRTYSDAMSARLCKVLQVKEEYLRYGSEQAAAADAPPRAAER